MAAPVWGRSKLNRYLTGIGERGSWIVTAPHRHSFPCHGDFAVIQTLVEERYLVVLLGWGSQKSGVGEAPLLGRVANHRHHGSVNSSTTNAQIKKKKKGSDSLRCNISSAHRAKNLIGLASLAVKSRYPELQAIDCTVWFEVLVFRFWFFWCQVLNNCACWSLYASVPP